MNMRELQVKLLRLSILPPDIYLAEFLEVVDSIIDLHASEVEEKCEGEVSSCSSLSPLDKEKRTPLMRAAREGHFDYVKILVDKHADIMFETSDGSSALSLSGYLFETTGQSQYTKIHALLDNAYQLKLMNAPIDEVVAILSARAAKSLFVETLLVGLNRLMNEYRLLSLDGKLCLARKCLICNDDFDAFIDNLFEQSEHKNEFINDLQACAGLKKILKGSSLLSRLVSSPWEALMAKLQTKLLGENAAQPGAEYVAQEANRL